MIIALTFWALSAICYAVIEKMRMDHNRSVWRKVSPTSFFGNESWWRKYRKAHWPKSEEEQKKAFDKMMDDMATGTYMQDTAHAHIFAPKSRFWKWYYKHFDIGYQERFPFSATALVFITDADHFFQWLQFNCFALAMGATYLVGEFHVKQWLITSLVMRLLFTVIFYLFFEEVLTKRDPKIVRKENNFLPDFSKKQLES